MANNFFDLVKSSFFNPFANGDVDHCKRCNTYRNRKPAAEVAKDYDYTRETLYLWQNEYAGGALMKEKDTNKTKQELISEIEKLKKKHIAFFIKII